MFSRDSIDFLVQLVETPSPSGFERRAQEIWRRYVSQFADKVESDVQGNSIAVINEKGKPAVMLIGHCDEIGFMVTHVNDQGFIYFSAIGGVDLNILPGKRVLIQTETGTVRGLIGKLPIHMIDKEEPKKPPKIHEFWIDIGARSKKEALSKVSIGDPIVLEGRFEMLSGTVAMARGFDDKMGAFAVAEAMRILSKQRSKIKAAVYGVASVQEEISFAGAMTSAFSIRPDVAIAVDVGLATDTPGVTKERFGETKLGKGPIIDRGSSVSPAVEAFLRKVAKKQRIPFQISASPARTGTDADAVFVSRGGVACGLISVPNRYMHTPVEVIDLRDLEWSAKLLAGFVTALDSKVDFRR